MLKKKLHWFISDKHGHAVLWQRPNLPIIGWLVFMVISHLLEEGSVRSGVATLSSAFLFTWSYLEITEGDSPFRRVLGTIVMIVVLGSLFTRQ